MSIISKVGCTLYLSNYPHMHRKSLSLTRNRCLKISANCVSSTDQWPVCDTGAPELGLASTVPSVESSVKVNHTFKHDLCCFLLVVLIRFVFIKYMVMKKPGTAVSCRQNSAHWPGSLPSSLQLCTAAPWLAFLSKCVASGLLLFLETVDLSGGKVRVCHW